MGSDSQAASAATPGPPPPSERRSSPFRHVRLIARGEDCEVLLASSSRRTSPGTPRWVALKRLRPDRVGDAETREAFRAEIELTSALRHPRIPRAFAAEATGREPWVAVEYVDGPDLATLLLEVGKRGRRLDLRGAWHVMVSVAEGLHFLHTGAAAQVEGIEPGSPLLHSDLVPDNILVSASGEIRVADLGRAWFMGAQQEPRLGTRGFTPALTPEQARGLTLDVGADIFLFGVLFYETLTGRHPFLRDTVHETAREVGRARPVRLETLRPVPPEVAALVDRCLDVDPRRRFRSTAELLAALRALDLPGVEGGQAQLAAEIASAFPAHEGSTRPWVLRGGNFRPPFLPMVLSWLPPPIVGPEAPPPPATTTTGPVQLGPDTGRTAAPVEPDPMDAPTEEHPPIPDPVQPPTAAADTQPFPAPRPRKRKKRRRRRVRAKAQVPLGAGETHPSVLPVDASGQRRARWVGWLRTGLAGALGAALASLAFLLFVPRAPDAPPPQETPAPAASAREGGSIAAPGRPQQGPDVTVLIQSQPAGATVRVDGVDVGTAPVTLRRPAGAMLQLDVGAKGFASTSRLLPVPDEGGAFTIWLEPG